MQRNERRHIGSIKSDHVEADKCSEPVFSYKPSNRRAEYNHYIGLQMEEELSRFTGAMNLQMESKVPKCSMEREIEEFLDRFLESEVQAHSSR